MNKLGAGDFSNLVVALKFSPPLWTTIVVGVFVLISLSLSIYLMFEHFSAYKNPNVSIYPQACLICLRFTELWVFHSILRSWMNKQRSTSTCNGSLIDDWLFYIKLKWIVSNDLNIFKENFLSRIFATCGWSFNCTCLKESSKVGVQRRRSIYPLA